MDFFQNVLAKQSYNQLQSEARCILARLDPKDFLVMWRRSDSKLHMPNLWASEREAWQHPLYVESIIQWTKKSYSNFKCIWNQPFYQNMLQWKHHRSHFFPRLAPYTKTRHRLSKGLSTTKTLTIIWYEVWAIV